MSDFVELNLLVEKYVADEVAQKGLAEIALRQVDAKFREFAKAPIVNGKNDDEIARDVLAELRESFAVKDYQLNKINNKLFSLEKSIDKTSKSFSRLDQTTRSMMMQVDRIFDSTSIIKKVGFLNTGIGLVNLGVDIVGFLSTESRLDGVSEQLQKQSIVLLAAQNRSESEKSSKCLNLSRLYTQIMNRVNDNDAIDYYDIETAIRDFESFINEMIIELTNDSLSTDLALEIICTLLPAYSALLIVWVEKYFKNKRKWPDNLPGFMSLYGKLLESSMMRKLEDFYFLNQMNSYSFVNKVITGYMMLVLNGRTQVEDVLEKLEILNSENNSEEFETIVTTFENDLREFAKNKYEEVKAKRQQEKAVTT